mmetsp:Transcript_13628/g.15537  ORF Transcript_13628/g.15537 Transcript_13628/m.15537 type:complete len:101 (-) Transcript_13628:258-560(-)
MDEIVIFIINPAFLFQASLQFANTFQILGIPVLHIKGDTHIFSCYSVENGKNNPNICILAIYTKINSNASNSIEMFDTSRVDAVMKPKIQELESFLAELI